ncbi:MAG: hypothetical protein OXU33_09355 [Gemmatimonadota bacterium]|nr:hypothetical protein [Gemmatimonadota bacterium]MDE3006684.1 hypothetical protein [Gemmatimonadota bacterium]MDE3014263.1 hypothetical protein [Gemmatimonadota bacterium]
MSITVLTVFVAGELLGYGTGGALQRGIALAEYGFVLILCIVNLRLAISYFVAFTLLALGAWTFVLPDLAPGNFWGLRLAGVSVNALATAGLLAVALSTWDVRSKYRWRVEGIGFLSAFFLYSLALGLAGVILGTVYLDNLYRDLAVFVPFVLYLPLVMLVPPDERRRILAAGLALGVVTMAASLVLGLRFEYAEGYPFLPLSSFGWLSVFGAFAAIRGLLPRAQALTLAVVMLALLLTGDVFLGAKTIALLLVTGVWLISGRWMWLLGAAGLAILAAVGVQGLVYSAEATLPEGSLLASKLRQVLSLLTIVDLHFVASARSSLGNLTGEAVTLVGYWVSHPGAALFGGGMGAGIPDLYGYLSPWAGAGGYALEDAARNEFLRFHLPVFEIALKAGALGVFFYLRLLHRLTVEGGAVGFLAFILLAAVLTNNKEMMLLTILCLLVRSDLERDTEGPTVGQPERPSAADPTMGF